MKWKVTVFFLMTVQLLVAQSNHWIYFKDKPNDIPSVSAKTLIRYEKTGYVPSFKDAAVNSEYIAQLEAINGVEIRLKSKWLNAVSVTLEKNDLLEKIAQLSFVKTTSSLLVFKSNVMHDFQTKSEVSMHFQLQPGIDQLNAQFLSDKGYTGEGMTIAVIDNGFKNADQMAAFSHVFNENRVLGYYDFVDQDTTVFDASAGSHGQYVWSFMAARIDNEYVGSAPNANYWLFRTEADAFEQEVEEDYWLAAAEMADSVGVDLITTSLNYTTFNGDVNSHDYEQMDGNSTIITRAADEAAKRGIFVVSSAGNDGTNPWKYIGAPADGDSVLTVGAVDADGVIAPFSSFGPTFDGRTKPDVLAWGKSAAYVNSADLVNTSSGTSFSAPLTAGLVACLWQAFPNKTANEIRLAIIESAQEFHAPMPQRGYGLSNFCGAYKKLGGVYCDAAELIGDDVIDFVYYNTIAKQIELNLDLHGSGIGTVVLYAINGDIIEQLSFDFINETGAYQLIIPLESESLLHQTVIIKLTADGSESIEKVLIGN